MLETRRGTIYIYIYIATTSCNSCLERALGLLSVGTDPYGTHPCPIEPKRSLTLIDPPDQVLREHLNEIGPRPQIAQQTDNTVAPITVPEKVRLDPEQTTQHCCGCCGHNTIVEVPIPPESARNEGPKLAFLWVCVWFVLMSGSVD